MSNTFHIISVGIDDDDDILGAVNEATKYFKNDVVNLDVTDVPKDAHNRARDQYRSTNFLRIAEKGIGDKNIAIILLRKYKLWSICNKQIQQSKLMIKSYKKLTRFSIQMLISMRPA